MTMTGSASVRKRKRKRRIFPAPSSSARLYVYIRPEKIGLFRYMLEAHDNLGLMTVVDRWRAALLLRFSPHRGGEMREFLRDMRDFLGCGEPFLPGGGV
ncbi:MAG: DUF4911 domain-containing protein [Desulfovibrio sp.]|jgi:hypothetical protein|nr:DUF4911 domain-containing protein [Desulfovibrio sp.]